MVAKRAFLILSICSVFLLWAGESLAGFGISPPYLINDKLTPGSHYEQKISLSRSNPEEDLKVQVSIDAPEIKEWITVDPGEEFLFPKGEKAFSMTLKVDVPKKADLKNYKGYIRVKVTPVEAIEKGQVALALGARIDVNLTVLKGDILGFLVRGINILNGERKPWPLQNTSKIAVTLKIENKGNVESSPTKAVLEVYDSNGVRLLEFSENKDLKKIKPFETEEITANFPTKLLSGTYLGVAKVYEEEQIIREEKMIFSIEDKPLTTKERALLFSGFAISAIVLLIFIISIFNLLFRRRGSK